ncbi:hypothetical protein NB311A_05600 [Nitrobacter sp. Nb-311A]|nr:hypothetical protein NB311A_05600 [Nitrobacter sp. Nb-311A]
MQEIGQLVTEISYVTFRYATSSEK